ncbi:hypothetical protein GCM10020331_004340 [Ectobacillus funiculus]
MRRVRLNPNLMKLKNALNEESGVQKATFRDLLNVPWMRRLVFIGIGVAVVSQATGVNSIMYYGTEILRDAGFETSAALIGNTANGVISVLATLVGIWLLDKVGRRPMMLTGLTGTTTVLLLIGIFSFVLKGSTALPYVMLTLTVTFLAFMQGAIGPVLWVTLFGDIPITVAGSRHGNQRVFFLWITNFFIGLTFPILLDKIGLSATFLAFAAIGVVAIALMKKYLPETKGRTLEELELYFRTHNDQDAQNDYEGSTQAKINLKVIQQVKRETIIALKCSRAHTFCKRIKIS